MFFTVAEGSYPVSPLGVVDSIGVQSRPAQLLPLQESTGLSRDMGGVLPETVAGREAGSGAPMDGFTACLWEYTPHVAAAGWYRLKES